MKADSDPVSKSQNSKKKRREEENPGFDPVNLEIGVGNLSTAESGSNPTPDLSRSKTPLSHLSDS